jgi:hypothetical protein
MKLIKRPDLEEFSANESLYMKLLPADEWPPES